MAEKPAQVAPNLGVCLTESDRLVKAWSLCPAIYIVIHVGYSTLRCMYIYIYDCMYHEHAYEQMCVCVCMYAYVSMIVWPCFCIHAVRMVACEGVGVRVYVCAYERTHTRPMCTCIHTSLHIHLCM